MKIIAAVQSGRVAKGLSETEFNGACVLIPVIVEGRQGHLVFQVGRDREADAAALLKELQQKGA